LDDRFLWLPFNCVVSRVALSAVLSAAQRHSGSAMRFAGDGSRGHIFERPAVLVKQDLLQGRPQDFEIVAIEGRPGVPVRGPADVREAEVELVRRSGKATDGIYSRFNRMLCRPAVRWLSHTPITPNAVTFVGLAVSVAAGLCFAQGSWLWDVAGAVGFFLSGLVDEIDGMLARVTFQESAFGCWLETMVDYSSYLLIFAGMAAGGYRNGGWIYLPLGASLLLGSVLAFVVISFQRRLAAPPERPNEYSGRYLAALDRDSANPISFAVRHLQFLTKKGVLMHYILLFAVLGALPALLFLSAAGANIAWIVTIYFNRRLFSPDRRRRGARIPGEAAPVEVDK
jgi:phosphatidylglycerophosphate synthase